MTAGSPLTKSVFMLLNKSVCYHLDYQQEWEQLISIISKKELQDIIILVKFLEESVLFIESISEHYWSKRTKQQISSNVIR